MELKKLETNQIIGDPIHGYIPLTDLEYNLLQLPVMNRLHYINQTAMAYLVFPESVTTRFSHVVGACHLGGKIITQLLSSIKNEEDFTKELFPNVPSREFVVKAVRLACLFHDVGHGPFSHAAEDAMLKVTKNNGGEIDLAAKLFKVSQDSVPIHEFYSYQLIMNGDISETLKAESQDLRDFVAELLVKSEEGKFAKSNPVGLHLIRNVVSSQLDADRLDYLLRDSMMSGVKFGLIDVDRIIRNMAIIKTDTQKFKLAIHERAIGNIEDMLDARYKMYRYFYNHHTVVVVNELVKTAVDMMVDENDKDVIKLLHWTSYKDGESTDQSILSKLRGKLRSCPKYERVRGLVDRRYLPLSFFKSNPDFARLIVDVIDASQQKEEPEVVREGIIKFFKESEGAKKIQQQLDQDKDLRECIILHTDLRLKPYVPFEQHDKIWLYRPDEKELCELSSESPYFKQVNEIWSKYHGLFVFYMFPGKRRNEFRRHREEIKKIMAAEIAKNL